MKYNTIYKLHTLILCFILALNCYACYASANHTESNGTYIISVAPQNINDEPFAVSSSSAEAVEAGMEVLRAGGNAVDAAVAVSLTLAVVEPYASGLGGGGFMLVYDPSDCSAWSIDYFSAAGYSEQPTGDIAVPGFLRGMQTALDNWGTMDLAELLEPAIEYAANGFKASSTLIRRLNSSEEIRSNPIFDNIRSGDTIRQPELAETLRRIQKLGSEEFYTGDIAEDIAQISRLSKEDLADYKVYVEPAVSTEVFGHTIYGTYAPSSAVTTIQMIKMAEITDIVSPETDTSAYMNTLKTITKAAYSSRGKTLADPRYYSWNAQEYLTESYLSEYLENSTAIEPDSEKKSTTQFSIIDSNGMTVCVTNSLSSTWGSYTRVDGFYLNNTATLFGESKKTSYEPMKRPRTHFSPLIIVGESGTEIMAIGSPGGNNIPRIIAPVVVDILKFGTDVQKAVNKSRVLVDDSGYACVEATDTTSSMVDVDSIPYGYYYSGSHMYFGCTSIVGRTSTSEVYTVNDSRRISSDTSSVLEHFFGW